jgi:hypothetical protein
MKIENIAAVSGPLPPLPEWAQRDDLGGLVPSQIREALADHARTAWNMGLNYGLQHAPAVTDIGLSELRDLLKAACVSGQPINLSHLAAGALYHAIATPPADGLLSEELQQLKSEAQEKAADGANWSMDVGCMFVLAMIERIEAADQQPDTMGDCAKCKGIGAAFKIGKEFGAQAIAPTTQQPAGYLKHADLVKLGQCRAELWARLDDVDAVPVFLAPVAEPIELATARKDAQRNERLFLAACSDLGAVSEALGLDPDDGGAEPIIEAINELRSAAPEGWKLVPMEPTPEIIAGAAIAVWPTASPADIALARLAAPIVLMQMDAPGVTADALAGMLATMAPAYRARLAAAPVARSAS